jgi:hypothetical protein
MMTVHPGATATDSPRPSTDSPQVLYQEGIVAGILAAAAVAVWFLIVDSLAGRPFYTPSVLGTALFGRGADLDKVTVSLSTVAMFTWVHCLIFAALGGVAARLLAVAERNPSLGFGVVLFFVILQSGFTTAVAFVAPTIFSVLGWASILVANLLAAGTMVAYFRLRHPRLVVRP